jgi:hypothetical protein
MSDDESTSNPIDTIYAEIEEDKIHLDSLKLDRRLNKQDYEFITRLPLSAKQLINILYELYPSKKECDPELEDLTESID